MKVWKYKRLGWKCHNIIFWFMFEISVVHVLNCLWTCTHQCETLTYKSMKQDHSKQLHYFNIYKMLFCWNNCNFFAYFLVLFMGIIVFIWILMADISRRGWKIQGGKGVSMALGVMYNQKRVKISERNVLRHLRKNEDVLCTVTAVFMCLVVLLMKLNHFYLNFS